MLNRRSKNANLRVENLEDRNLMAGDVAVHVLDGNLFVSGDQEANGIELTSTAVNGQFIVSGLDAGGEATTVNGETSRLVVDGINRNVLIRMGNGDDLLRTPQLNVKRSMQVRMGAGDDSVHIGDAEADAAVVSIGKGLNIHLGAGNDRMGIANAKAQWIRANGAAGNDELRVRDSVSRTLRLAGRAGDDDIRVTNAKSTTIGISGGLGDDTVRVEGSQAKRLSVHLGAGDDALSIKETEAKRVRVVGAAGTDSLATDLALGDIFIRGLEDV